VAGMTSSADTTSSGPTRHDGLIGDGPVNSGPAFEGGSHERIDLTTDGPVKSDPAFEGDPNRHGGLVDEFAARPEAYQRPAKHARGNPGSWLAVSLIILGFALGTFALPTHLIVLWVLAAVAIVAGGILALTSRIMEQTH
jgi:hypothetical protein